MRLPSMAVLGLDGYVMNVFSLRDGSAVLWAELQRFFKLLVLKGVIALYAAYASVLHSARVRWRRMT